MTNDLPESLDNNERYEELFLQQERFDNARRRALDLIYDILCAESEEDMTERLKNYERFYSRLKNLTPEQYEERIFALAYQNVAFMSALAVTLDTSPGILLNEALEGDSPLRLKLRFEIDEN